MYFDVKTGPYPAFIFTLSLSFAYNTTANSAMPCEPRWQMSPMEHAQFLNFSKGDDTGKYIFEGEKKNKILSSVMQRKQFNVQHFTNMINEYLSSLQESNPWPNGWEISCGLDYFVRFLCGKRPKY